MDASMGLSAGESANLRCHRRNRRNIRRLALGVHIERRSPGPVAAARLAAVLLAVPALLQSSPGTILCCRRMCSWYGTCGGSTVLAEGSIFGIVVGFVQPRQQEQSTPHSRMSRWFVGGGGRKTREADSGDDEAAGRRGSDAGELASSISAAESEASSSLRSSSPCGGQCSAIGNSEEEETGHSHCDFVVSVDDEPKEGLYHEEPGSRVFGRTITPHLTPAPISMETVGDELEFSRPQTNERRQERKDEIVSQRERPRYDQVQPKERQHQTGVLHTYRDPMHNITLLGLNISLRKFHSWADYSIGQMTAGKGHSSVTFCSRFVTTREIRLDDELCRERLRRYWNCRQLISERTEPLAVYASNAGGAAGRNGVNSHAKRGGFRDLLSLYADRLAAIVSEEWEDHVARNSAAVPPHGQGPRQQEMNTSDPHWQNGGAVDHERFHSASSFSSGGGSAVSHSSGSIASQTGTENALIRWLKDEYGKENTQELMAERLLLRSNGERIRNLQRFLDWFRTRFPYYYDRCDCCGASARDKAQQQQQQQQQHVAADCDEGEDGEDDSTFLGYVFPNEEELMGKASRTEIYLCKQCGCFTRFARYNAAAWVLRQGRGRCGEYSMLLFRILRAAGYEARWVVDWADHVWTEIKIGHRWVHLDPCEAAVDRPLLYQEWGKEQTYIMAFRAPQINGTARRRPVEYLARNGNEPLSTLTNVPRVFPVESLIEDVTAMYTSDTKEGIRSRRDESPEVIEGYLDEVERGLREKLHNLSQKK